MFDEEPAEHMKLVHPDLEAAKRERAEIEAELMRRIVSGEIKL